MRQEGTALVPAPLAGLGGLGGSQAVDAAEAQLVGESMEEDHERQGLAGWLDAKRHEEAGGDEGAEGEREARDVVPTREPHERELEYPPKYRTPPRR